MNRRGFISLLTGAAGAAALPSWRMPKPIVSLAAAPMLWTPYQQGHVFFWEYQQGHVFFWESTPRNHGPILELIQRRVNEAHNAAVDEYMRGLYSGELVLACDATDGPWPQ